jgi:curved DNA-binding protein CbpA
MSIDFYSILSVPRDAKPPQIKRRFIELARERHPDRFQGEDKIRAEEEFQSITEAFNVLMDPLQRRQHDIDLTMPSRTGGKHDPGQLARVYLNRGIRAYKSENLAEAADNFERATRAEPRNYQAWHHLALACSREERWLSKAQQAIERACELRPGHAPYFKLAGKIFAMSKMTARAKEYYNQALKSGGVDPAIHKALKALGQGVPGGTASGRASEPGQKGDKPSRFKKVW